MSTSEGPIALALGVLAQIPDPTAQWGNPAQAVQIQNSSGFVVNVTADGEVFTIQPFVAQTLPLDGGGSTVTVLPTANPYGLSNAGDIYAIFLLGSNANAGGVQLSDGTWVEAPPMEDGPLTAAAIAASIEATTNIPAVSLFNGTWTPPASFAESFVLAENILGLRLFLDNGAIGTNISIYITAVNVTTGQSVSTAVQLTQPLTFSVDAFIALPVAGKAGDTIDLDMTQTSGTSTGVFVSLVGVGTNVADLTTPGFPLAAYNEGGTIKVAVALTVASSVILAAPPTDLCYRLHRLALRNTPGGNVQLFGTVTGNAYSFILATAPLLSDNLDGLIANEGLSGQTNAGVAAGTLHYDLVSFPAVL